VFLTNWLALRVRAEANVRVSPPNFVVRPAVGADVSVFKVPTAGAAGFFGAEVLFL
jgi:hypothetical protein